jgi:hypothetical protein
MNQRVYESREDFLERRENFIKFFSDIFSCLGKNSKENSLRTAFDLNLWLKL